MADMEWQKARLLSLLRLNRMTVADIAKATRQDVAGARRLLDTASLEAPVYEVRRGVYAVL